MDIHLDSRAFDCLLVSLLAITLPLRGPDETCAVQKQSAGVLTLPEAVN